MVDTSKEAVERIASHLGTSLEATFMLRALRDERDAALAQFDECQRMLGSANSDRDQLAGIVNLLLEPDENVCCDGHQCGCQGAGTHQFAAYLFAGMKMDAAIND